MERSEEIGVRVHARLTDEPLSVTAANDFAGDPDCGAVVVFTGTVRRSTDGRDVRALTYEAFVERAQAQLDELARAVASRHEGVAAMWCEHRVGTLAVGEPSVIVAVGAAHRPAAFEAARDGIDTLKSTVAIWKQEHWADGSAHWPGTD